MILKTTGLNPYDDHIAHYGILGMRWGRRKHRERERDREYTPSTLSTRYNMNRAARQETAAYRTIYKRAKKQYRLDKMSKAEAINNPYMTNKQARVAKKQARLSKLELKDAKKNYKNYRLKVDENAKRILELNPSDLADRSIRMSLIKNSDSPAIMESLIDKYMKYYDID